MKWMSFFKHFKSTTDEKKYKSIQDLKLEGTIRDFSNSTRALRQKVEIVLIDDEQLDIIELLSVHDFKIVFKKDIEHIKDVEGYDVILCDIKGVGKKFQGEHEGAYLISEIRKAYPSKVLIAYTGSTYDPTYNKYIQNADLTVKKGTSGEEWVEILDDIIKKSMDITYQWKKLRQKLLESDIEAIKTVELEDAFVQAIQNNKFENFEQIYNSMQETSNRGMVKDFMQSLCIRLIKEVITNG